MRLVLFVEGKTERKALPGFVARWLNVRLTHPVAIDAVSFGGNARFLKEAPKKARMYMEEEGAGDLVGVVGLLDLYGLPLAYLSGSDVGSRYKAAKARIEREVGQRRFRQFFAVHETEAWLLSKPAIFPAQVRHELEPLSASPERVDFEDPPAKRLTAVYRTKLRRRYKKAVDGPFLFDKLDPDLAAGKCPHFKQMLEEMLALARSPGV